MIAFRDKVRNEGFAEWTVESNLMTVTTMLRHNPLKTALLKPQDWPEIPDSDPNPVRGRGSESFAGGRDGGRTPADQVLRRHRDERHGSRTLGVGRHRLGEQDR